MIRSVTRILSFDLLAKLMAGLGGILIIRYMPETQYAQYTLAMAAVGVVAQTLASGFNRIYVVGYERFGLSTAAAPFLGLQLLLTGLLALLLYPLRGDLAALYLVVVLLVAATCLAEFAKSIFQRDQKFRRFSLVEVARSAGFFLVLLGLIALYRYEVAAWQVLTAKAAALALVASVVLIRRLSLREVIHLRTALRLARHVLGGPYGYLFGYFLVLAIFGQLDVFMLNALSDAQTLAAYGSAFRYYSILLMALGAVRVVLLPVIQQAEDMEAVQQIYARHRHIVLLFVPAVVLGGWLAQWLIPLIDGGKYPEAILVFRILAASAVLSLMFSPHINLVLRFEDFRFLFVLSLAALVLNASLNALLIPTFGAAGAAATTLVTFGAFNGAIFLRARHHMNTFDQFPEDAA